MVAFVPVAILVVPEEEIELIRKFGAEYHEYQKRTDKFTPFPAVWFIQNKEEL